MAVKQYEGNVVGLLKIPLVGYEMTNQFRVFLIAVLFCCLAWPVIAQAPPGSDRGRRGGQAPTMRGNLGDRGGSTRGGRGADGGDRGGFGGRGRGGERGGGPPMGGGPMAGGDADGRASRLEGFLRSMDTNGDGVITENEVPEQRRAMLHMMAARMGLDASQGIAISTIRDVMLGGGRGGDGGRPPERGQPAESGRRSEGGTPRGERNEPGGGPADEKRIEIKDPLVPGFGTGEKPPSVPNFGERVDPIKRVVLGATLEEATKDVDRRMRGQVQAILRRYDRNHNRVLEREEWAAMPGNPAEKDRNRDGKITIEELAYVPSPREQWDRNRGGMGGPMGMGMGMDRDERSDDRGNDRPSSAAERRRASYRFLMAHERLPQGLPDWFIDRDTDLDGQVSMSEFAEEWNDSVLREYLKYDANNDGVITPEECLSPSSSGGEEASSPTPSSSEGEKPDSSGASTPWWMQP